VGLGHNGHVLFFLAFFTDWASAVDKAWATTVALSFCFLFNLSISFLIFNTKDLEKIQNKVK
jgi:hypothetical protein